MLNNIIAAIVAIGMAVWVYQVVNRQGGQLPWLWAIGAFVFWPLVATIAGYKYHETAMKVVGIISLVFIVVGIVMGIGMVAIL